MQALLTSVLDRSEWRLYPRVRDFVPIEQEPGWASETGLDGFGNFRPSPSFETPTIRPVASRYADWAIPAALSNYQMSFKRIGTTYLINYFSSCRNSRHFTMASSLSRVHNHRRTTLGRTFLYDWSARRRDLYLTTHNNHNRHPYLRRDSNPE